MTRRFDDVITAEVVVVGSGVAGLTTALALAPMSVLVISKTHLGGGSTSLAQGGIAAPLSGVDSPHLLAEDTLAVGGGLNDPGAVQRLATSAAAGIETLRRRGARFDLTDDGGLALGLEAGHSVSRVVHANGDATGAEVSRTLAAATRGAEHLRVLEGVFAADLVVDGPGVGGLTVRTASGERLLLVAGSVVLATGGVGRIFANTTNPPEVTGDGMAMARRAGARLADMEFVQFHPTALATGRDPMPLLTEALRGEGAVLVDDAGDRFMLDEHPQGDLAPRDVVARAVWERTSWGRKVYLDAGEAVGERFPRRFPTVFRACLEEGIDPRRDPIPVDPAAHYAMGGVAVDLTGRSSLAGLWAVGETSRTGVHGANRLASNSLLEGLVFGDTVAADVRAAGLRPPSPRAMTPADPGLGPEDEPEVVEGLRRLMWEQTGVVRHRRGLAHALAAVEGVLQRLSPLPGEARNMAEVATMVVEAALARTESRGAHYRADFPERDRRWDHSLVFNG